MHHTAYFGDGEKTFALTTEMIHELERKTGVGIAALYGRFMRQDFHFADMVEIIRTGLIGGGTSPAEAQVLVDTYAKPRPIMEIFPLAFDILDTRWNGKPDQDETGQAAASGDLAAAIDAAYADVSE
ncbi:hypothetical protein GCM10011491_01520 [Brucella endophytica]|uniref:Gene transfer agent family protein n=1 Tax=Brucella endophytica TaxID=1963359 RepID=A0A916S0H5_9HYPH|nr:gene transfer agent family protein [Brucella endophytica]GGA78031.1 hypothetical protein GCM10011491_01520 [Brucella endophytica]